MTSKRKDQRTDEDSRKRFRRGIVDDDSLQNRHDPFDNDTTLDDFTTIDHPNEDIAGDELVDELRYRKKNGEARAAVESSRAWNFICTFEGCDRRFNRASRLEEHLRSHRNERPWACDTCDKTFPRKDHLTRHVMDNHKREEREHVCDWDGCDKRFATGHRLKLHIETHTCKFYCTEYPPCKQVFRRAHTLDMHVKIEHMKIMPFQCDYVDPETNEHCTSEFKTVQNMRGHQRRIHEKPKSDSSMHFCMLCPAPGSGFEELETEAGTVKVVQQPLAFAKSEQLSAHTREYHPPLCTHCNRSFADQTSLAKHIRYAHTDLPPEFICTEPGCNKAFTRSGNLTHHIRTVHTKVTKFICESTVFAESKHEDLRNWDGADACGAALTHKNSLEQHVRTKHLKQGNRKTMRKEAKAKVQASKKMPQPSALRLLTGIGDDGGRNIACPIKDCGYKYFLERDIRKHLSGPLHNFSEEETEEHTRTAMALSGGKFWFSREIDAESAEPSVPQTPEPTELLGASNVLPPNLFTTLPLETKHQKLGDHLEGSKISVVDEEAALDAEMGLDVGPALDMHTGLPLHPTS